MLKKQPQKYMYVTSQNKCYKRKVKVPLRKHNLIQTQVQGMMGACQERHENRGLDREISTWARLSLKSAFSRGCRMLAGPGTVSHGGRRGENDGR